jgi:hypothetical protein
MSKAQLSICAGFIFTSEMRTTVRLMPCRHADSQRAAVNNSSGLQTLDRETNVSADAVRTTAD